MTRTITTSKGLLTIRPAVPEDAARLQGLRIEALATHPTAFAADHAAAVAEPVARWEERLALNARDQEGIICVAAAGEALVGMTGLALGHWPKTRPSGFIWGVYVGADWRGFHVAEALIEECITWGKTQGAVIVKLGVATNNISAIRCYTRCGFTVYGVEPKAIYYDEVYYDELLMAKGI